jgi:integrase/recombinase XerD
MFEQLFTRTCTIARHQAGPSLALRVSYLEHLFKHGMCRQRIREVAARIYTLSTAMDLDTVRSVSIRDLEKFAGKWAHRENPPSTFRSPRGPRKEMFCVTKSWMRFLGMLDDTHRVRCPHSEKILAFQTYLTEERGLAANTIKVRSWYLNRFFGKLGFGNVPLERLSPKHVADALRMVGEQGWARGGIQQFAIALRVFFTFAESRGWCRSNLAAAAVGPRLYRQEYLPQGPAWVDVQRLLVLLESERPTDIRDRPIVLLLAIYGLRVSEVFGLTLDNLDWENESLTVTGAKTGRPRRYPLTGTVGDAIIRYLKQVRPTCARREVFLALNAPYRPLTQGAIYGAIARRFRQLGVSAAKLGPHGLRHACATHLLAQGTPLPEISNHLGHRSVQSTRIYAKVDLPGLQEVADVDLKDLL